MNYRAEAVILDVAEHLLAVLFLEAGPGAVEKALGLDEHERMLGLQQIIHGVPEDFELRLDVVRMIAQSGEQRQNQLMTGRCLGFLIAKARNAEPLGFKDERFKF